MSILPPCLCNRPQKSTWLKLQCSNCLGILKDSENINCSSQASVHFALSDTFSKSLIEYLSSGNKFIHKRSCTDKTQQSSSNILKNPEKTKYLLRNPSEPLLIHKPNQLSAPALINLKSNKSNNKKKEYLKREILYTGHTNSINSIEILDNKIWTAGADYKIFYWDLPQNSISSTKPDNHLQISSNFAHSRNITCITSLNPETLLTSSIDKTVKSWKATKKLKLKTIYKHKSGVKSLSILNKNFISSTNDSKIHIWDLAYNSSTLSYSEHLKPVLSIENFKYNTFLTGSEDSSIKLWDSRTVHSISSFNSHFDAVTKVKIIDQYTFLSSSKDMTVRTWDIRTSQTISLLNSKQEIFSLDYFKDFIIIGGEKLQLWSKGVFIGENSARAKCLKYIQSNHSVVVGSFDNSVSIYKLLI
ncbi:hypothetical protein SteCoe_15834 [Stentor coeruleus]|uniref:Anaphase-promoting complex subunit 4 WD40 domain-containing protein n=1 Tax=Stentor coeruleus TaxID=5963 RepID=A0A1R2C2Y7_9CILI|nr:hypothetical protein SteCoe_15834 [Stentor coeruleus]